MNAKTLSLVCAGLAAGIALTLWARGVVPAHAERAGGCTQWQTAIAATVEAQRLDKVPEPGAVLPVNAPAGGWEPFAVGTNGIVYYRRCAP